MNKSGDSNLVATPCITTGCLLVYIHSLLKGHMWRDMDDMERERKKDKKKCVLEKLI